jgi:hypothetical protein
VNRCTECAREIQEPATTCEACSAWAAALVEADNAAPTQVTDPPTAAEGVTPPASSGVSRGVGRRQMLLIAAVVGGVAIVAFGLLFARSGPSSSVSAAAAGAAGAAAAAPRPSSPNPSRIEAGQKWSTDNRAHWLGERRRGAAFELPAENIVQTWFGPVRPSLVVRCMERTTQAFVYVGSPTRIEPSAEGKTVTVSVDDEAVRKERWPDADDHDALFAPDGTAFAQRLLHAQTLRFGYSPHNASDVVAEFRVSGLAELIGPAAKECGWTK